MVVFFYLLSLYAILAYIVLYIDVKRSYYSIIYGLNIHLKKEQLCTQ
jgi:hypothetical protein